MEIGTKMMKITPKARVVFALVTAVAYTTVLWLFSYFFDADDYSMSRLIFQGVFFGVFFGVAFPFLFQKLATRLVSKNKLSIKPELSENEQIEIEGPANLFRGIEGVGGKIFLTNNRLIFKSHQLNIQKGQTNIDYQNIHEVLKRKTAKVVDNGFRIVTKDAKTYDFVVNEREVWLDEIGGRLTISV